MNKAELVDKVAAEAGVEKREAEAVLSAAFRAVVDGVAREPTWTFVSNVAPFFAIASQTIAVSGFLAGTSTTVQIQVALIDDPCTILPNNIAGGNGFVTFEVYPTLVTTVINH